MSGTDEPIAAPEGRGHAAAFAVHLLTASGAAWAMLALLAAADGRWAAMFAWLGLALVTDALDGPLARALQVADRLPRWSGDTLDLVVDILTYVFVPAFALAVGGLLPAPAATPLALLVVTSGALYFADRRMKSASNHFVGFPAVWNVVVFYLFLLRPPPLLSAGIVIGLAGATFLRLHFVHPVRVATWRPLTLTLLASWAALAVWCVVCDLSPGPLIQTGLSVIALYFFGVGLLRRPT